MQRNFTVSCAKVVLIIEDIDNGTRKVVEAPNLDIGKQCVQHLLRSKLANEERPHPKCDDCHETGYIETELGDSVRPCYNDACVAWAKEMENIQSRVDLQVTSTEEVGHIDL